MCIGKGDVEKSAVGERSRSTSLVIGSQLTVEMITSDVGLGMWECMDMCSSNDLHGAVFWQKHLCSRAGSSLEGGNTLKRHGR